MFQRKNSLFQNVCMGLAAGAVILFSVPCVLYAEEKADAIDELSLYDLRNLDQVLITATKNPMEVKKAPAIATVITDKEIRNMGARNLEDVLRRVPGFGVRRRGVPNSLEVRGIETANTEKILLMIDGHRINTSFEGSWMKPIANDLMVENIKRVEIIRGPGSALYGSNAFVGVVNVITKTAEDIDGHQFSVSYGSFDTQHYNGLFSYKDGDWEISGHVDYLDTDGDSVLIEEDAQTLRDQVNGTNASLAPGNTVEFKEKWDAGIKVKYGNLNFTGRIIDKEFGPRTGAVLALNDESLLKGTQIFGEISYSGRITEQLSTVLKLYGDNYEMDNFYEIFPEGFTGKNDQGLLGNPMVKNRTLGGEITMNYDSGSHLLTGGLNYEYIEQYDVKHFTNFANPFQGVVDASETGNHCKDAERIIWAVYLQDFWKITDSDTLTLGVRYDNYDDFGGTLNPRAGYVHEFGNGLTLKLLYGSAFRAPTFSELYSVNNPSRIGNPDLDPEEIKTYEVGIEYPFMKNCKVNISYFHNEIKNLIMVRAAELGPQEFININGTVKVDGGETELTFDFAKNGYGYINCSYQYGKDENDITIPDVAEWRANAGLNYGLSRYINANLNVSWVGERKRAEGDPRDDLSSDTLVDLTLVAKNFYKTLELCGSVHNLFDEDYRDPWPNLQLPNDMPGNSRMFMLEVRYKF